MLFSLTVFVLSYNLETSLGLVGVNPQKLSASYLSSIGECFKCVLFGVWGSGRRSRLSRGEAGRHMCELPVRRSTRHVRRTVVWQIVGVPHTRVT